MKMQRATAAFVIMLAAAMAAWADIPPPTVNQNLGIPDSVFNLLTATVCRTCHNQNPPPGIPVNPAYLPDRHHQHVGTSLPTLNAGGRPTDAPETPPYPDSDGDGQRDAIYACLNCHNLIVAPVTGELTLNPEYRNCLRCHQAAGSDQTVHHKTPWAIQGNCGRCHGGLIASVDEGQPPPTYQPSMVTPWPSGKPNADFSITSSAGTHPGNCNFCHNTEDGTSTGTPNVPTDKFGTITVFTNIQNHHGTGVGELTVDLHPEDPNDNTQGLACAWCHDFSTPAALQIRTCQRCHDRATLHNIEFDAIGDGIVPGQELPFNGHVGDMLNCWGCHGNDSVPLSAQASMNMAGATVPFLYGASVASVKAGTEATATLIGNGFINTADPLGTGISTLYQATVLVTDAAGRAQELTPSFVTPDTIEVVLPANLTVGGATLQAKKLGKLSNPIPVVVKEQITLTAAYCYSKYNVAVILGGGLSDYLPAVDSGTTVSVNGQRATWVYRWANGMIAAQVAQCADSVQVNNVNGAARVRMVTF